MSDGTQSMWLYGAISDEAFEIAPIQYLLNLQFDKLCDTQRRIPKEGSVSLFSSNFFQKLHENWADWNIGNSHNVKEKRKKAKKK